MITDFFPIPEIGCRYQSKSGDFYIIKDVQTDLGSIPDYVEFVSESAPDGPTIEYTAEDWNALDAVKVMSEPISDPQPQPSPNPQPQPALDPQPEPEPTPSDGIYSNDPRINELAKLLQDGPKKFNQEFYPTDKTLSDNNMVEHDVEDAFQKTLDEIDELRLRGAYDEPYIEEVDEDGKQIKKINPKRKKRRCGLINEFLWGCGGLDRNLLRMCPTDWAKKAGMGGTILGTAMLATFSGGFALNTVFENTIIAIIGGILWGLVIFNLDRYLVNSMYSDGDPGISKKEFKSGLPRIIIAIFLGIVISTPIELKIFEGKINEYLTIEKSKYIEKHQKQDLSEFNIEDNRLKGDFDNAVQDLQIVQKCMVAEEQGLIYDRSTGEISKDAAGNPLKNPRGAGNGDAYKELKNKEPILKQKADSLKKIYDEHHKGIDNLIAESKNSSENNFAKEIGLSKKLEAMSEITSSPESVWYLPWTWSSLAIIRMFISLMFIILEVLPVINKMMQTDGEYDKLIDLESDTREKLTRVKEFNNINVLRSGNLSMYRNQIVYGKIPNENDKDFKGISDEPSESENAFAKNDYKKRNRNETDDDNYEIYSHARKVCTRYIKGKIDKIFVGVLPEDHEEDFVAQDVSKSHIEDNPSQPIDPSNDAVKI